MQLANWDGQDEFRRMLDVVNRANASFYPVNPRGLEVFDSPINAALPLSGDRDRVRARTDMIRTLAENTDGVAVLNTNDLGGATKRIVDDLSNQYLLGYYSTGKLDGRFHPISVRVKRPGVQVRARRGYLASTPAAPEATGALFIRRGLATGNKDVPTADLRFRRSEQVRVEIPTASSDPLSARLLDRTGKPIAVPVAAAVRDDTDGWRWHTAQLALDPLAPGDYVIEVSEGTQRRLTAFRIVP